MKNSSMFLAMALAVVVGFFAYHFIIGPEEIEVPVEVPVLVEDQAAKPDTNYWAELEMTKEAMFEYMAEIDRLKGRFQHREKYLIDEYVKLQNQMPGDIKHTTKAIQVEDEQGTIGISMVESFKEFNFKNQFAVSKVWVSSLMPAANIKNELTVDYQSYREIHWDPILKQKETNARYKGIIIGGVAIGGIASQNEYAAIGGLGIAGALYYFWK